MFRTVPLSIIRRFPLYTQQWYLSYICSCSQAVSKPVWHIPLLCVHWKTPDNGQRNCPKNVEFQSKIKNFEKLLHLVGSITRNFSIIFGCVREYGVPHMSVSLPIKFWYLWLRLLNIFYVVTSYAFRSVSVFFIRICRSWRLPESYIVPVVSSFAC